MNEIIEVFPWSKNFETGFCKIDEQHKVIVCLINQLASHIGNQSSHEIINEVFRQLVDYAGYHFKYEESVWDQYLTQDTLSIKHHQSHQRFFDSIMELKQAESSMSVIDVSEQVLSFLTHWLAEHILDSDMRLSKIILAIKAGVTLDQAKLQVEEQMGGVMKTMLETTLSMYDSLCKRTLDLQREIQYRKTVESKLTLASSVFDNTLEAICITDHNSLIVDANNAFFVTTGYGKKEVIGQHISQLKSGLNKDNLTATIWQELNAEGHWSGEITSRNSEGELQNEWLALSTIKHADGSIINYIGIFSNISTLIKNQLELQQIAHHDVLTQLPNRLLLADRLKQAIANADRKKEKFSVCYLDLDGFKPVNDNFGHAVGDQLLCEISQRIKKLVRGNDTVARVGGDEFVVLLNEIESQQDCEVLLDRLLETISLPIEIQGNIHQVTGSIGVAIFPQDSTTAETLLSLSDKAMFQAKRAGKSRYFLHQSY